MAKFMIVIAACLVIGLLVRDVNSALTTCATSGQAECDAPLEPNSICVNDNCACIATYASDGDDCVRVACTSSPIDHAPCTTDDANSYCDGGDVCSCKKNFVGTGVDCSRKTCSAKADCTEANSYCATTAPAGCTCGMTTTADANTGACTVKTCTLANQVPTCGTNTMCHAAADTYQCTCAANYESGASGCTQKACSAAGDCDTDSACTDSLCVCASTFSAPSSSTRCKKDCTGTGSGVCAATNAACTNSVCECNVNWEGNGATCTQIACSGAVTTTCHPNSKCSSNLCVCADGWVTDGTVCKETCTASSSCATNALCISDKCECKVNYVGDGGTTCAQKECSSASDCTGANTACTASKCECAAGYESSTTAAECILSPTTVAATTVHVPVGGANVILCNFLLLLVSFVASLCATKIF